MFVQQDEQLLDALQHASASSVEKGRPLHYHELPRELKDVLDVHMTSLPLNIINRLISTTVTALVPSWERNFMLLQAFHKREGHVKILKHHREEGMPLGSWLSSQVALGRKGKLLPQRRQQLENFGICFDAPLQFDDWLQKLTKFCDRTGHLDVPPNHVEDGRKLGQWLNRQRASSIKHNRQQLEQLGVDLRPLEEQWSSYFDALEAYIKHEGNVVVPKYQVREGRDVGGWLDRQRARYSRSRRDGGLSKEKRQRLQELGIELDIHEANWQRWYVLLMQYQEREGDVSMMKSSHEQDGEKLGAWFARQKLAFRKGELSAERSKLLQKLDASFSATFA